MRGTNSAACCHEAQTVLMGLLTLACLSPPPVPSQLYRPPSKKEHSRRLDAYESWLRKKWGSKDAPETCRGGGGAAGGGFGGCVGRQ